MQCAVTHRECRRPRRSVCSWYPRVYSQCKAKQSNKTCQKPMGSTCDGTMQRQMAVPLLSYIVHITVGFGSLLCIGIYRHVCTMYAGVCIIQRLPRSNRVLMMGALSHAAARSSYLPRDASCTCDCSWVRQAFLGRNRGQPCLSCHDIRPPSCTSDSIIQLLQVALPVVMRA